MKTPFKKISSITLLLLLLFGLTGFGQVTINPAVTPACTNNGAVTFNVTGGSGSYTFYIQEISPVYNSYPQQTSPTLTNLAAGVYQVYLMGNSGDSANTQFTIPSRVNVVSTITNTSCPTNAGAIVTTASGGQAPYSYNWSNGAITTGLSGLAGGIYYADVTDANGCFFQVTDTVIGTTTMNVNITSSGPVCSPTLTAVAAGGTGITYAWSNGQTTPAITSVTNYTGYSVTATDANGCSADNSTYVSATMLWIDSSSSNVTNPGCQTTGSIAVNMTNGTAPYSYVWSNNATTRTIAGLAPGQYDVTVTDANGCSGSTSFYLYYQTAFNAFIGQAQNPTCGNSDGSVSADANVNGNTTGFNYLWSNGSTLQGLTNIPAGAYNCTITDVNSCSAVVGQTLVGIPGFTVSISTTPTACDTSLHTGSATAIISGIGTAPYSFIWTQFDYLTNTNSTIGYTQSVNNLSANTYLSVRVTDANGCTYTQYGDSTAIQLDPSCYDHITGYVFMDANGNCTYDQGEQGVSYSYVIANGTNGSSYYANPDTSGYYDLEVLPGTYTVLANLYNNSGCTVNSCSNSHNATFGSTGLISTGNNFGIGTGTATFDVGVHMGYEGSAPGQQRTYWVYYYNWGLTSVASGVLTFVHDPNITLVSTSPNYTSYNAATHTLTWDINNNLDPMQWLDAQHQVVMQFDIPQSLSLGTILSAAANITPVTGDCDPSNNSQYLTDIVSASHDPNEKEVSPAGNLMADDTVLTYTIRFQNDGNAPANLIVITDTLSPNVDPSTVQPGASSAPYVFKMVGNGVISFTFNNINLPDSVHNVDSSKGFVMYTVHTKRNLAIGTQVKNTAYIYFDANPAVVTNTTNSLRSNFPTSVTNLNGGAMTAQVMPNPASEKARINFEGATGNIELNITDALGNIIAKNNSAEAYYTLNAERLASGIYFYTAKDANGNRASGKISIVH